eukprot:9259405-Alexandrium_andersonii.AAC.2
MPHRATPASRHETQRQPKRSTVHKVSSPRMSLGFLGCFVKASSALKLARYHGPSVRVHRSSTCVHWPLAIARAAKQSGPARARASANTICMTCDSTS